MNKYQEFTLRHVTIEEYGVFQVQFGAELRPCLNTIIQYIMGDV